jgi:hypothetical protein
VENFIQSQSFDNEAGPPRKTQMSHPDPKGPPDTRPILVGEVWENPVTRERATILELPQHERAVAELTALVGARVMGNIATPGSSKGSPCSTAN